jgi:hypothetical protein
MNAALGVLFAFFGGFAMPSCARLREGRQSKYRIFSCVAKRTLAGQHMGWSKTRSLGREQTVPT